MRSRTVILAASLLLAGLLSPALAQEPTSEQPPGAPKPVPATVIQVPPPPPAPTGPPMIPVPDGPAIDRKELPGGIVVEEITLGTGHEVKKEGIVVAHYHGTLRSDGSEFDSSFRRGQPVAFPLTGVIKGWQDGVPGMKVGGVRKLTIPAALAYGAQARDKIPANSDLVFVIQLVDALHHEDIMPGTGEEVWGMCVPVTAHTVKDAEGKEIEKAEAKSMYIWIPGEMNAPGTNFDTLQVALKGMKVGGKRRIFVPKEMNGHPGQLAVERPQNIPLVIELELLAMRNLEPKPAPVFQPTDAAPAPAPTATPSDAPTGR